MLAAAQLSDRLALDVQGAQALRAGAKAGDAETLRTAARQFEAMVVQMMLKTLRENSLTQEDDVLGGSQGMKLYRDMLDQQWAQKMASGRGLGFAETMVKAMEARNRAVPAEEAARMAQPDGGEAKGLPLHPEPSPGVPLAPRAQTAPAPDTTTPPSTGTGAEPDYRRRFIQQLRPHAERVETETGIPARHILAHAALETGWGRHAIRTADGGDSHNLFGIKAGRAWSGGVAEQDTTEYQQGIPVRRSETFRAYAGYAEALRDYAGLLERRYPAASRAGDDAAAFAQALAEGGYATDPDYAGKLKGVIASVAALGA